MSPVPQPQQTDSIDQASKLIDLIDKLGQRQSGANLAPGTSQFSPMNAAQFQSANPQQIALQELLLRNPQLIAQLQQSQLPTQQQQTSTEKTYSQQQVADMKAQFDVAVKCANEHYQQLLQLWQTTKNIMQAYNAICEYAKELENAVGLGEIANTHANAFLNELNAAYDMINVQHQMLTNPLFLLTHSFSTFKANISANDSQDVDLVSSFYIEFVRDFEEKHRQISGQYSPQYTEYLQSTVQQPQTQPNPQQPQQIDSVLAWAKGLQSQGFGTQIKRAHTQQLLQR